MVIFRNILFLILSLTLHSCSTFDIDGMIVASSTVKDRFINSTRSSDSIFYKATYTTQSDSYTFVIATDFHIKDSDLIRYGKFISEISKKSSFGVFLGDFMYESGSSLSPIFDSAKKYDYLFFPAIGNHDVYKNGYQTNYRPLFGPTCYYFKIDNSVSFDLLIVLDSANGTLGGEQTQWLETILDKERDNCRHCFIFTHANFFSPTGYIDVTSTYTIEEQMYLLNMFSKYKITNVFSGHSHVYDFTNVDQVDYVTLDSWILSRYMTVECRNDNKINIYYK